MIYEFKNLTFTYAEGSQAVLKGIDLSIDEGEFVVLCGKSGCGKSTLLKHLKTVLTPYGEREGEILYRGKPLDEADLFQQSSEIGFVQQNPENQIVTDKVWHELAFGLESLGYNKETIRLRVAEMASFFGIQGWYHKSVHELSGGQKQLLNLAAVMAMQPDVLILDEPTSQLDPIAASDFLATVKKINDEIGTTIILTEHRLEDALPKADRVLVMNSGEIIAAEKPRKIGYILKQRNDPMLAAMPAPMRLFLALENGTEEECPVTVREGREYLRKYHTSSIALSGGEQEKPKGEPIITLKEVWFRYEKEGEDIVRDLSAEVYKGEMFCLVGGNGTGKTTALNLISGLNAPYRGKIRVDGLDVTKAKHSELFAHGIGVLPQDPQTMFVKKTVKEDLLGMLGGKNNVASEHDARIAEVVEIAEIADLLDRHPYDISGGEQQRVALAMVLLTDPKILLLDEPTKGMDSFFKNKFARVLKKLQENGVTLLVVSHDVEFCAVNADRCALFFDGSIVTEGSPRKFFSGNSFYTTSTNRMCRSISHEIITVEDAIKACRQEQ